MFHTMCYRHVGLTGAGWESLFAVFDDVFSVKDGDQKLMYGQDTMMFAAAAIGENLDLARVESPSLQAIPPMIRPIIREILSGNDPNMQDIMENPVLLRGAEGVELKVQVTGVTQTANAVLFVTQGLVPAPPGPVLTIHGTAPDVETSNEWTDSSVTWDVQLPAGKYAVVGAECYGPAVIAHRWIFDGQLFRPGGLGTQAAKERTHELFYDGALGTWGVFNAPAMPRFQVFQPGSSVDPDVILQVVRL